MQPLSQSLTSALPSLPQDTLAIILSYLNDDPLSLARLSQSCRSLRILVQSRTSLYPQVLSTLVANVLIDAREASIDISVPKRNSEAKSSIHFNAAQSLQSVRYVRNIVPNACFEAAIRNGLGITSPEGLSLSNQRRQSMPFLRIGAAYNSSRLHVVGCLSVSDDCVDYLFDLSEECVHSIKSVTSEHHGTGLQLRLVITSAMETLKPTSQMFQRLHTQVIERKEILDERTRIFRRSASSQSLVCPNRRHVSEKMFATGKWDESYSLRFLRQCQYSILEELREQRLQATLAASTNLSMSPYSCLSAKYITGHLSQEHEMTEQFALAFTIETLQEVAFAHQHTIYNTLKRAVLRRSDEARSLEHACCICFWGLDSQVMDLVDQHFSIDNIVAEMSSSQRHVGHCATRNVSVSPGARMLAGECSDERRIASSMPRAIDCGDAPDAVRNYNTRCSGSSDESDEDMECCVIEKQQGHDPDSFNVFLVDDAFDITLGAIELREWSIFFYACNLFVQHEQDDVLARLERGTLVDDVPGSIAARLLEMLRRLISAEELLQAQDPSWSMSRYEFVSAVMHDLHLAGAVRKSEPHTVTGHDNTTSLGITLQSQHVEEHVFPACLTSSIQDETICGDSWFVAALLRRSARKRRRVSVK